MIHSLVSESGIFNCGAVRTAPMSLQTERDCPQCDNDTFWRVASTTVHLGEKIKWRCTECDYGIISIDGIETA
jgi:transposase-like protein